MKPYGEDFNPLTLPLFPASAIIICCGVLGISVAILIFSAFKPVLGNPYHPCGTSDLVPALEHADPHDIWLVMNQANLG